MEGNNGWTFVLRLGGMMKQKRIHIQRWPNVLQWINYSKKMQWKYHDHHTKANKTFATENLLFACLLQWHWWVHCVWLQSALRSESGPEQWRSLRFCYLMNRSPSWYSWNGAQLQLLMGGTARELCIFGKTVAIITLRSIPRLNGATWQWNLTGSQLWIN